MPVYSGFGNKSTPTIAHNDIFVFEDKDGITITKLIEGNCDCGRRFIALPIGCTQGERFWLEVLLRTKGDLDCLSAKDTKFFCSQCGTEIFQPISMGWHIQGMTTKDLEECLEKKDSSLADIDKYMIEKYGPGTPNIFVSGKYAGVLTFVKCSCGMGYRVFHPDWKALVEKISYYIEISGMDPIKDVVADGNEWQCTVCGKNLVPPPAETLTADKQPCGRDLLPIIKSMEEIIDKKIAELGDKSAKFTNSPASGT